MTKRPTVVKPIAGPAIAQHVEDFLASRQAKNPSPRTIEAYEAALHGVFLPFCASEGIRSIDQVTQSVLDRLNVELLNRVKSNGKRLSPHSVRSYLRHVNVFLKDAKTGAHATLPKADKVLVQVLTRQEIATLEETASIERDKVIVRLLADTGIREGELCKLRLDDLQQLDRVHYLRVQGKGRRERQVPLPPGLAARLRTYLKRQRPTDIDSDRMFVGLRRRPGGTFEPLTGRGVRGMVVKLAQQAGFKKRVYPHLLRHSYATWMLTRGTNPIQLAKLLGHSSLSMITDTYSHLSPRDGYDALMRALTLDREEG